MLMVKRASSLDKSWIFFLKKKRDKRTYLEVGPGTQAHVWSVCGLRKLASGKPHSMLVWRTINQKGYNGYITAPSIRLSQYSPPSAALSQFSFLFSTGRKIS